MRAEQAKALFFGDELEETARVAGGESAGKLIERKGGTSYRVPGGPRLRLRQPDVRDLGIREDDLRHGARIVAAGVAVECVLGGRPGAELGANVALTSFGTIGGTCVNIGCVPSKTLIRAAG